MRKQSRASWGEHDGFSSLLSAIEAGTGVAIVMDSFAYSAGKRVKLLRLIPEPEGPVISIGAPKGPFDHLGKLVRTQGAWSPGVVRVEKM